MNLMKRYSFLFALGIPLLPIIGYFSHNNWFTIAFVFIAIPLLDIAIGRDRSNPEEDELESLKGDHFFKTVLHIYVPIQLLLLVWGGYIAGSGALSASQWIAFSLSIGIVTGAIGITAAHELLHKKSSKEKWMSKILLGSVCYGHFFVEHPRGHHVNVSTPGDPASAKFGESLYRFLPRTIAGSWLDAWALEKKRLERDDKSAWDKDNQILQTTAVSLGFLVLFHLFFGPMGALKR